MSAAGMGVKAMPELDVPRSLRLALHHGGLDWEGVFPSNWKDRGHKAWRIFCPHHINPPFFSLSQVTITDTGYVI